MTVRAGQTSQVDASIPNGSTCSISEPASRAITPYGWDDVSITPETFTISDAAPVAVQATNTISQRTVTASLHKIVDDPEGGFTGDPDFQVSLVCHLNGNTTTYGPEAVKADGTVSFSGILVGSACAPVEEPIDAGAGLSDASFTWGLPTFSEEQQIGDLRGSYIFTIVNHVERAYGTLALEKVLDDPDHVVDPSRTYDGRGPAPAPVMRPWPGRGPWTGPGRHPGGRARTGDPARLHLYAGRGRPHRTALVQRPSYSWDDPRSRPPRRAPVRSRR